MKQFFKKVLISYLIIICCIISPVMKANANAVSIGWAFKGFDFSSKTLTAIKNGVTVAAAVDVAPIATKVGKGILGGAIAGAAIPLAISQITGLALDAVTYVMDPANNQVILKNTSAVVVTDKTISGDCIIPVLGYNTYEPCDKQFLKVSKSLAASYGSTDYNLYSVRSITKNSDGSYHVVFNPMGHNYDVPVRPSEIKIPISQVVQKFFDNAAAGDPTFQTPLIPYFQQAVADGTYDPALDKAAEKSCFMSTHWNGTQCIADAVDPNNPDIPIPSFDPSSIIDAIKSMAAILSAILQNIWQDIKAIPDKIIKFFTTIWDYVMDWKAAFVDEYHMIKDWAIGEPDTPPDNKLDIDTTPPTKSATDFDTDYLRFGGQCPAPVGDTLQIGAVAVPLSLDMTPLCDFVVLCRPAILAMAYLAALFVVARAIGETQ